MSKEGPPPCGERAFCEVKMEIRYVVYCGGQRWADFTYQSDAVAYLEGAIHSDPTEEWSLVCEAREIKSPG